MADGNATAGILRRKLAGGAPVVAGRGATSVGVLERAAVRAAQETDGLVATPRQSQESRASLEEVVAKLGDAALLVVIDDGAQPRGLVMLDTQSLAALIEVQTIGRVVPRQAQKRGPTRTDALLASGFIGRMLALFHELAQAAELPAADMARGLGPGRCLPDARAVGMTLPDGSYSMFELELEYGDGAKTGQVTLALLPPPRPGPAADSAGEWRTQLEKAVACAEVRIDAVLARKRLALGELSRLRPGAVIALPGTAIENVRLCDLNGREVNTGVLGQANGFRAVMVTGRPCDDDPAEPPAPPGPPPQAPATTQGALDVSPAAPAAPAAGTQIEEVGGALPVEDDGLPSSDPPVRPDPFDA